MKFILSKCYRSELQLIKELYPKIDFERFKVKACKHRVKTISGCYTNEKCYMEINTLKDLLDFQKQCNGVNLILDDKQIVIYDDYIE